MVVLIILFTLGDTIQLTATFTSPDLPIFESRLTNLILGRNSVERFPNNAAASTVVRNFNTTLVNSAAGPSATGALSTLAVNTDFKYTPGSDEVIFTLVPNMMPKDASADVASDAFITTDDFDSISDFTFYGELALLQRRSILAQADLSSQSSELPYLLRLDRRRWPASSSSPRS